MIRDFRLDDPDSDARQPAMPASADVLDGRTAAREAGQETGPETEAQRDHAALVAAHEAATGWSPERAVRLASLTSRIAKLQRQMPVTAGTVVVAFLAGAADLALAALAIVWAVTGNGDRAEAGVLILLAMFVPTVWAAWILTRLVQRRRVHTYRAERERLRRDRGCGDLTCARCD
jgi:hypothetical protein